MSETHADAAAVHQHGGLHLVEAPPVRTLRANPHPVVHCEFCSRSVFWADTVKGKRAKWDVPAPPHQPQPEQEARFVIDENGRMRYLNAKEKAAMPPGTRFYLSHFATCPYSRKMLDRFKHVTAKASR